MYTVLRQYAAAPELFDLLVSRESEVREIMGKVSGLQCYALVRTDQGGFSVTITENADGAEESTRVARTWIEENAPGMSGGTPVVSEGEVIAFVGGAVAEPAF